MIQIGRLVVKTAGRDAGKKGVIIDILDDKFVIVDGEVRRRKVNVMHIEPLAQVIDVKKNASHEEIKKSLDEIGLKKRESKPKQKVQKPMRKRKTSEQLKAQKEEKRKLRNIFKPKKKEAKEEKTDLEKAVEHKHDHKEHTHADKEESKETKKEEKKKAAPKKTK